MPRSPHIVRIVRYLTILALTIALGSAAVGNGLSPASAAASPARSAIHGASSNRDTVSGTVALTQTFTSTSGLTTITLPTQMVSGKVVRVQVHTAPRARLVFTLTFADGSAKKVARRANAAGESRFAFYLSYQPQVSSETATFVLRAVERRSGLDDTITQAVVVLQHIVLRGSMRLPRSVAVGTRLPIVVYSNPPGATIGLQLTYPDGRAQACYGGRTDAAGMRRASCLISSSDGTRGYLTVRAELSYQGVVRRLAPQRVLLRAHR